MLNFLFENFGTQHYDLKSIYKLIANFLNFFPNCDTMFVFFCS